METKYLKINPADNVAVAIVALPAGEKLIVDGKEIVLNEDVPAGHKFALQDLAEGENVIKYGYPIGHARTAKKQGDWMNENNIKTNLAGLLEYTYNPTEVNLDIPHKNLTFKGYRRKNGDVGVRNEIWIIPTVGCVNGIINQLAEGLRRETESKGVDAIMAFPHNYGCSQLGDDHENTKKILRDMVLHPNAGAVLVVGLGCENNQPDVFREFLGEYDSDRVKFMVTQKVGDEYEEGMKLLRELYEKASKDERVDVPLSELRVGLKCGGSDGFSGITANPLLGMFSDFLIAQGGTSVLTEVPEMFGAETILMNRCRNKELFEETVKAIFNKAVRDGLMAFNPVQELTREERFHAPDKHREYLTADELKRFLAVEPQTFMEEVVQRAFGFSCMTGLRLGDMQRLRWSDIKDVNSVQTVSVIQHKTKRPVAVPLNALALSLLLPRPENGEDGIIFPLVKKPDNVAKYVRRIKNKAGIEKDFTYHSSRHSAATLAITAGAELYSVSKILGHGSIASTQVYAKVNMEKKVEAMNLTNGVF